LFFVRRYYMNIVETLFPDIDDSSMLPAIGLGIILFLVVSICNMMVVKHKIVCIWKRKE
jgi:putative ATP/GTP-binding transmembrane protein